MKSGFRSTEFWLVAALVLVVAFIATGKITTQDIQSATGRISDTSSAIPAFIDAVKSIVNQMGDVLIAAGLVWAYLKRRSSLKAQEMKKEPTQ